MKQYNFIAPMGTFIWQQHGKTQQKAWHMYNRLLIFNHTQTHTHTHTPRVLWLRLTCEIYRNEQHPSMTDLANPWQQPISIFDWPGKSMATSNTHLWLTWQIYGNKQYPSMTDLENLCQQATPIYDWPGKSMCRRVGWGVREAGWKHGCRVTSQRLL